MGLIGLTGDTSDVDFAVETKDRLVVFFSSACEYCRQSIPVYTTLTEICDPSLTLAFTDLSSELSMAAWWEKNGGEFSEECRSLSIGRLVASSSRYQVRGTPTHYLIGSDGLVKHRAEGMLSEVPAWLDR